ncbi:MAG: hypothetical protein ACK5S6_00440 [bacterium]
MKFQAELVTGPTVEPLTLNEAKKQLEISTSDTTHDVQLAQAIQEAREQWEHDTDSVCCYQTWKIRVQSLADRLALPKRPIQSITSITYFDGNNASQTLSASLYQLHINEFRLAYQATLPATSARWDAWTINYRCGYSQDATLVPAIAKRAMLLLVGHYFENRDMLMSDAIQTMKPYESLVMKFMRSNYP